jgi:hypothetical protein
LAFTLLSYFRCEVDIIRTHCPNAGLDVSDVVPELKQCDTQIQELAAQLSKEIELDSYHPGRPVTQKERRAYEDIFQRILTYGRSFSVTENGRVCNAMNQPEKGDLVAAFEGSDRLFILRPTGERYRLVGDAYVDGLMEGEAYEGLDSDDVDYDIELV